jgi:hypothetical protein
LKTLSAMKKLFFILFLIISNLLFSQELLDANKLIYSSEEIIGGKDTVIMFYPIFLSENGLMMFVSGELDSPAENLSSIKISFLIKLDTSSSSLGLQKISMSTYKENNFGIDKKHKTEFHNYIYYKDFCNAKPCNVQSKALRNDGTWEKIEFVLNKNEHNCFNFFQIGLTNIENKKATLEVIKHIKDELFQKNQNSFTNEDERKVLLALEKKGLLKDFVVLKNAYFYNNKKLENGQSLPKYFIKDVKAIPN